MHLSEARTTFGVWAEYTCHDNYTLSGVKNRTCGLTGWTGKQPECLVDWCPDPPSISGGTVSVNERRAGSIAKYECEVGYVLIGEPVSVSFSFAFLYAFSNLSHDMHIIMLYLSNDRCRTVHLLKCL